MGSGNRNGEFIVFHNLSKQVCTGEHGNVFFFCAGKFRIVRVNGRSVNHQVHIFLNIRSSLPNINSGAFGFQVFCQIGFFGIRTGNWEIFTQKYFRQSAHTDTADTDKVNMNGFMKINLIHNTESLLFLLL